MSCEPGCISYSFFDQNDINIIVVHYLNSQPINSIKRTTTRKSQRNLKFSINLLIFWCGNNLAVPDIHFQTSKTYLIDQQQARSRANVISFNLLKRRTQQKHFKIIMFYVSD